MALHSDLFGDPLVDARLSDAARLQAMLDVEVALAHACVAAGLAPASCVEPIRACAVADRYDAEAIAHEAARAGNIAIPLVRALTAQVRSVDAAAADFVHLGATSQDIIDSGLMVQLRDAILLVVAQLDRAADAAAAHADRHRHTPMAGRTWMQQATPVTFGLKAAGWLDALHRGRDRLTRTAATSLVLQFGGASGTLASLGPAGDVVSQALADALALPLPAVPWHAHRDRVADVACALGIVTGTLGKIARDLSLLSQTEVAEAVEGHEAGRGGSSTMPHKRNPVSAAVALAAAGRVPGLVSSILSGMPQEHERGLGGWQAEWDVLPDIVRLAGGAARAIAHALEHLIVDTGQMAANLEKSHGLTLAESVVVTLASALGPRDARTIVDEACRHAIEQRRDLIAVLSADVRVTSVLTRDDLTRALAPRAYLGSSEMFLDRVLAAWSGRASGDV